MAELRTLNIPGDNPAIVKDASKCVECGHCVAVCTEQIGVCGHVIPGRENEKFCIHCGQCSTVCGENAITLRSEIEEVKAAIRNPKKVVIFSTSPSTRVGFGDEFVSAPGTYAEGKMVNALRKIGGDYVLDVTFAADLTIMEEGTELLKRVLTPGSALPQFTSCCPAWVKYVETFHPEYIPNLSSAKSPIGMQGAVIKTYFAAKMGINPRDIVSVAVTPCTAKKFEIRRPELNDAGALLNFPNQRDNDYVITAKELVKWVKDEGIAYEELDADDKFDNILGKGTGAAVIFGNTGGVMEAALRMAYEAITGEVPTTALLNFEPVRGLKGIKEAEVTIGEAVIKTAVVYGTANAEKLLTSGKLDEYTFVEVMTCPGGCISGAGMPQKYEYPVSDIIRKGRMASLYAEDANLPLRNSPDNPEIQTVYEEFFDAPLSELSEKLLHTSYYPR